MMHRYKTAEVSETTPILGTIGVLRAVAAIKVLLVVLVVACGLLCVAGVVEEYLGKCDVIISANIPSSETF